MNKCPNCGSEIAENNSFCVNCGAQVNQKVEQSQSGTGHLLINRKKSFYGCAISLSVTINNVDYKLNNGEELNFDLQPGTYCIAYKVWNRRKKEVTINVAPGREYFIEFVNDYLWGGFKLSKNSKLN